MFSAACRKAPPTGAVIPIENTLAGSVHENYDHLQRYEFPIVAETNVRIVHNLMAPPGVPFSRLRRVYSHPVALNQCLDFFARHPRIERITYYDTAGSAKMIMEEQPGDAAAIASAVAAEIYGARILRRSIEDDRRNFTRFFLLRTPPIPANIHQDTPKCAVENLTCVLYAQHPRRFVPLSQRFRTPGSESH